MAITYRSNVYRVSRWSPTAPPRRERRIGARSEVQLHHVTLVSVDVRQDLRRISHTGCRSTGDDRRHGKSVGVEGIDPWLELHLRAADRRDLLKGTALSQVQAFAVQLIDAMESKAKGEDDAFRIKLALMGIPAGERLSAVRQFFPELVGEDEADPGTGATYVYSDPIPMTPERAEELLRHVR